MYAIAPAAEGIPAFTVPFGEQGPLPAVRDKKPEEKSRPES